METIFNNANEAFNYFYDEIVLSGKVKEGTRYIRNIMMIILRPFECNIVEPWRKWNRSYAELEWQWYLNGDRSPEVVEKVAKIWSTMKDDSGYVNSNYGYWWKRNNQLGKILDMLQKNPNTRRAIIVHYNPDELDTYNKDTPCNVVLNFYVENNLLNLTVFARSIDLVYGFCNDQYCFSKLMMHICDAAQVYGMGTLTYMITDLHIYEKHFEMKTKFYNQQ